MKIQEKEKLILDKLKELSERIKEHNHYYHNLDKPKISDAEFDDLIKTWTEASQKILLMMNKEQKVLTENRSPKSLMAFGAMGAHINMALKALKATESDH